MKRENDTNNTVLTTNIQNQTLNSTHVGLTILALIGYHLLFWHESFGVNILLFTALILGWSVYKQGRIMMNKPILFTAIITLVFSIFVVVHGSYLAKFGYLCSLFIYLGFLFQPNTKSIVSALPSGIFNLPVSFINTINKTVKSIPRPKKYDKVLRWSKIIMIPLAVLILFVVIFSFANPIFSRLTNEFFITIFDALSNFFKQFSLDWIFFMIFGVAVVFGVSINGNISLFADYDKNSSDFVIRKKRVRFAIIKRIGLKEENKTAVIMMTLINLLLLLINAIDVKWIWFDFRLSEGQTYSQLVHQGTYLLILSILISMGIIFYYFRKNQNFYAKNKKLKMAAYLWIIQNVVLAISVAIRNIRYIEQYGLTYKRIGVLFFLVMTCIGLIALFLKIKNKKSVFYVLKFNSWALYILLFIMAAFNWDIIVVRYNLSMTEVAQIDKYYLLSFSDKTLPILQVNREKLEELSENSHDDYRDYSNNTIEQLNRRISGYKYKKHSSKETFLSWNYADDQTSKFFK